MSYRLFVSEGRTILVRMWLPDDGSTVVEIATREEPDALWGPPIRLAEEEVTS